MVFPFRGLVIFLALVILPLTAEAEETPTCAPDSPKAMDYSWIDELQASLKKSIPRETAPSEPEKVLEPEEDEMTGLSHYDLAEPALSRLRKAVRTAAEKCRIRRGRKICGSANSKFQCYRGVKEALVGAGLVSEYWSERPACDAHEKGSLTKLGFQNILSDGYRAGNAPLGAVLVYSGGAAVCHDSRGRRKGCGHIEVKLNENEFCSDHCKSIPVDQYLNRKLVGVYVKK